MEAEKGLSVPGRLGGLWAGGAVLDFCSLILNPDLLRDFSAQYTYKLRHQEASLEGV